MTHDTVIEFKLIPYPTDKQRREIKLAAWGQLLKAGKYDAITKTYTITEMDLINANIPIVRLES